MDFRTEKIRVVSTSSAWTSQGAEVSIKKHGPIGNEEEKCPWASFQGTDATVLRPQCLSCPRERKRACFVSIKKYEFCETSSKLRISATLILSYSYSQLLLLSAPLILTYSTLSYSFSAYSILSYATRSYSALSYSYSQLLSCLGQQKFVYPTSSK